MRAWVEERWVGWKVYTVRRPGSPVRGGWKGKVKGTGCGDDMLEVRL